MSKLKKITPIPIGADEFAGMQIQQYADDTGKVVIKDYGNMVVIDKQYYEQGKKIYEMLFDCMKSVMNTCSDNIK